MSRFFYDFEKMNIFQSKLSFFFSFGERCHFACKESFKAHNLADQSGVYIIHSSLVGISLFAFVIISWSTSACFSSVTQALSSASENHLSISIILVFPLTSISFIAVSTAGRMLVSPAVVSSTELCQSISSFKISVLFIYFSIKKYNPLFWLW